MSTPAPPETAGLTIDEVARRSGVSKATIYKHRPDRFPLAVEAFGGLVTDTVRG